MKIYQDAAKFSTKNYWYNDFRASIVRRLAKKGEFLKEL